MDFGDKGVWYRIFMGHFQTREAAEAFIAKHQIHGAEVKETKYAVRLGAFGGLEAMEAKKNVLSTLGLFPYTIKEADGQVSLFTGAFLRKEDAERECRDLKSKGIQAETVER
jgi:cell division septation protein DedD